VNDPAPSLQTTQAALHAALRRLLAPLARLAVAKGVTHAALDDWLREAMVAAAYESHPDLPPHRRASRITAATGLHRREVQRLLAAAEDSNASPADARGRGVPSRSLPAEVFIRWRDDPIYAGKSRQPRALPRTGPKPSFETLAQEVTRDVHPRTLLEELLRLELAIFDTATDTVRLAGDDFVPQKDQQRMLGFLGDNVGDHLDAAVTNVVDGANRHVELAVYADGLADTSLLEVRKLLEVQWRALSQALVPTLERLIDQDERAAEQRQVVNPSGPRTPLHRFRLGLYSFDAPIDAEPDAPSEAPIRKSTTRPRRSSTTPSEPKAPVKSRQQKRGTSR
jgi:hypothetical protein